MNNGLINSEVLLLDPMLSIEDRNNIFEARCIYENLLRRIPNELITITDFTHRSARSILVETLEFGVLRFVYNTSKDWRLHTMSNYKINREEQYHQLRNKIKMFSDGNIVSDSLDELIFRNSGFGDMCLLSIVSPDNSIVGWSIEYITIEKETIVKPEASLNDVIKCLNDNNQLLREIIIKLNGDNMKKDDPDVNAIKKRYADAYYGRFGTVREQRNNIEPLIITTSWSDDNHWLHKLHKEQYTDKVQAKPDTALERLKCAYAEIDKYIYEEVLKQIRESGNK